LEELEAFSTRWPVAVGGQGARMIEHLLRGGNIELIDDLTALQSRLMSLASSRMSAART
jgi:hypothetical protein